MPRPRVDIRRRVGVLVLAVASLAVPAGVARAAAAPVPEGTAITFACTEPTFAGPAPLRCPRPYNPRYDQVLLGGFDRFTPAEEFKMQWLEPSEGRFDFSLADQVAAFARGHGKTIRGHTLIFGRELPAWIALPLLPWSPAQLTSLMHDYISEVVGHFAARFPGVVPEWDVVNEPLLPDGLLYPTMWESILGPGYIRTALRFAHAADPRARLVINEDGADAPGPKADALFALASRLKQSGAPLDAVGFQAHVTPDSAPTLDQLVSLWRRYAQAGLDVEVTELDVGDDLLGDAPNAKDDVFRRYALACRMVPNCTGLTVWGVADPYSWLGARSSSLLYDSNFNPRPIAAVVRDILTGAIAIHRAPSRRSAAKHPARRRRSRGHVHPHAHR